MRTELVNSFATTHNGLVTLDAARAEGISSSAWYRSIATGELEQIHPGVARLPGSPANRVQAIAAAVLACGHGALASHRSALALHGSTRPATEPIDVIIRTGRRQRRLEGVITHRPRDLADLTGVIRHGVPCTTIVRTLCDLGAVDPDAVHDAVGHALAGRLATMHELRAAAAVHSKPGRHGVPALRAALDAWAIDGKPADSVLELAMRRVQRRYGLAPMEFHAIVEGYEVDFLVSGTNIVLECDGWSTHGLEREQFEFDKVRRDDIRAAGYTIVEFTYRKLTTEPADVAKRIRAQIRQWAPQLIS